MYKCWMCWHFAQCGKHLHDRIISLRGEAWVHNTTAFRVQSQESQRSLRYHILNKNGKLLRSGDTNLIFCIFVITLCLIRNNLKNCSSYIYYCKQSQIQSCPVLLYYCCYVYILYGVFADLNTMSYVIHSFWEKYKYYTSNRPFAHFRLLKLYIVHFS